MPDTRPCCICDGGDDEGVVLLCDSCNVPHHAECVGHKGPVLGDWFCPLCRTAQAKAGGGGVRSCVRVSVCPCAACSVCGNLN